MKIVLNLYVRTRERRRNQNVCLSAWDVCGVFTTHFYSTHKRGSIPPAAAADWPCFQEMSKRRTAISFCSYFKTEHNIYLASSNQRINILWCFGHGVTKGLQTDQLVPLAQTRVGYGLIRCSVAPLQNHCRNEKKKTTTSFCCELLFSFKFT